MSPVTTQRLEIVGVAIGAMALLYTLFHHQNVSVTGGASAPVLLGSGGGDGATGLSSNIPNSDVTLPDITWPPIDIPPITIPPLVSGGVTINNPIGDLLAALASPGGNGCCAQSASVPFVSEDPVPVANPVPLVITPATAQQAYQPINYYPKSTNLSSVTASQYNRSVSFL